MLLAITAITGSAIITGALAEFQQAERGLPNNVDVIEAMALVQRRLGRWEEAIGGFRRVIELDPRIQTRLITISRLRIGACAVFPKL